MRAFLDGTNVTTLVSTGIQRPVGISVDITTHNVYWVDNYVDAIQVECCMSGSNFQLQQSASSSVCCLTTTKTLPALPKNYCFSGSNVWHSSRIDFQMVSFDGTNRQYVRNNMPRPYGVSIFGDDMYWVDQNLKEASDFLSTKLKKEVQILLFLLKLICKFFDRFSEIASCPAIRAVILR